MWTLFGSQCSGSAAIEMALRRCELPYRVRRASTWEPDSEQAALVAANPLGQIPTLVSPAGTVLTESAAILIHLGLEHPGAALLPAAAEPRAQALRGLVYLAANCYAAIGVIDYPERWLPAGDEAALAALRAGARQRLHACWDVFATQFAAGDAPAPAPFMGGERPGALDFLAGVVSRWSGARAHLAGTQPRLAAMLERIEADPDCAPVFAEHWPRES